MIKGVLWADLTYSWFGSFHAFFAVFFSRLLGKKSVVVAGGYDVSKMPEINYGLLNMRLWRLFSVLSFKLCDKILAVSQYTKKEAMQNLGMNEEKIEVVAHGFDKSEFHPKGKKEDIIITIGRGVRRKGFVTFAKAANLLLDVDFYLIGEDEKTSVEALRRINSRNLFCEGFISQKELIMFMQRSKVYVQISAHEGFGCALAEAMLCECIPVVTARGAIPEVVGDAGMYVPYGDAEATADMIKRALNNGGTKGKRARKRIEEKFPIQEREKKLIEIIMKLQR